ncbi:hypothetical protein G9A89_003073 [Geosiphon pyriformis]|nr:hypothetical protein G9A89_003073 [Geosiphon pyriformis]
MPIFNGSFIQLSTLTGVPPDHLRLLIILLLAYPLAVIFKKLPPQNQKVKHLFSISFAAFVFLEVFDLSRDFYMLFLSSLVCYAVSFYVQGIWGPRLVFLIAMGHLSISHIYRQLNLVSTDRYDLTGPQMVLVIKLVSFAFSVYDGKRPIQDLTPYQKRKRIIKIPPILEFLGYMFFFGGVLVGPAFEFRDYNDFTTMESFKITDQKIHRTKLISKHNLERDYSNNFNLVNHTKDDPKANEDEKQYFVSDSFYPAMQKLAIGLFWLLLEATLAKYFPFEWTLSEEYKHSPFLYRFFYLQIAAFCARFKYYLVWILAEGACILSGLGFNGYDEDGNAKWDRVTNVDVFAYETADNIKTLLEAWNINTNKWLKNHVYLRITPPGKRGAFFATFATFTTSALWHGFYPGYYLTFISGAFVQSTHKAIRRKIRPFFLTPKLAPYKRAYDLFGWFVTHTTVHYLIVPFLLLSLRNSLYVWKLNYFVVHIAIILINMFFILGAERLMMRICGFPREELETKYSETKNVKVDDLIVLKSGITPTLY